MGEDSKRELDSISQGSGKSQISHLSLSHTNELLNKKKLDTFNRPSVIGREVGNRLKHMVNQQAVFDKEAEKQLSDKVCLHDQMEKRLQRLKKKLNPEQMKKHEEAFKKKYGCGDDDGHDHHGTGPEHVNDGHWHHGDAAGHSHHHHGEGAGHRHHHHAEGA